MDKIMTLGIFAHANAGKTTLTEEFLYHTNVKKQVGRVDHGNTTTDSLEIEQKRGISVKAAMVTLNINDKKIQLIDTPGHVDFASEVERAISVLDGAILVVSGVEGVEPQTRVIWNALREKNVPTLIFINKMDRMGADYDKVLKELQEKLDGVIVPRVRVSKNDDSLVYEDIDVRDIVEELSDADEEIMDMYLNDEEIDSKYLEDKLQYLSNIGKCFLVYGGSALLDEGVKRLIDAVYEYLPDYQEQNKDFSGYIYNVDRSSGIRELYVKVLAGRLNLREKFPNSEDQIEQIKSMMVIDNNEKKKVDYLEAGQIGIIHGLSTRCGEIIGNKDVYLNKVSFVNPMFETTLNTETDENKYNLFIAASILGDEDPGLDPRFNKDTGEITIRLVGGLQGEIIKNMIETRFNIPVILSKPIIVQKEAPTCVGSGQCGYTRVSAVELEVRPLERGSGLRFVSELSTDVLFSKYQKQIERLIYSISKQGLYGWELTDAEIALVNGKCDNVGSEPEHFNIATPLAFMRALKNVGVILLEPTVDYEINVPQVYLNNVIAVLYENSIPYEEINTVGNNSIIKGNSLLRTILNLNLIEASSGTAIVTEKASNYIDSTQDKIIERNYYLTDPRNEEAFLVQMMAAPDKLDMAPPKRRKPQKKPNRILH